MAEAIAARLDGDAVLGTVRITPGESDALKAEAELLSGDPSRSRSGEFIVVLDWAAVATGLVFAKANTRQVADAAIGRFFNTDWIGSSAWPLASLPIHLIGHSRGGSLMSELSERFGRHGVWVDQLTLLDPHPRDFITGDGPVEAYSNTMYAESYYQTDDSLFVNGQPLLDHGYDRKLSVVSGGYVDKGTEYAIHANAHLWYFGTINQASTISDGEATLTDAARETWYTPSEERGSNAGFRYSRLGGGSRWSADMIGGTEPVVAGLVSSLGGLSTHSSVDRVECLAELITLSVGSAGSCRVLQGSILPFQVAYCDADSPAILELWLDIDRNPLNGNEMRSVHQQALDATQGIEPAETGDRGIHPALRWATTTCLQGSRMRTETLGSCTMTTPLISPPPIPRWSSQTGGGSRARRMEWAIPSCQG
ncbi:MAG: hypothetical protein IPJ41_10500 [Phycisphaerales bacterium]|nr:hypothetical protein [Phycisphaerales bacterium]